MFGRLNIYFREMYPLLPRLGLAAIMFFEIYFVLLLNTGVRDFRIGFQEAIGVFTIFVFLMILRIADDFKDYETDQRLFPERALPSGRVHKRFSDGTGDYCYHFCLAQPLFHEQPRLVSLFVHLRNSYVFLVFQERQNPEFPTPGLGNAQSGYDDSEYLYHYFCLL